MARPFTKPPANHDNQISSEILIYQAEDGSAVTEVRLDRETVWLTQAQMSELFGRERSVITRHINNTFKEGELDRDSVCANFAHTAEDGKTYSVLHFNLDVIISVGCRVKSLRGTQFRIWANRVLKEYLTRGYSHRVARKPWGFFPIACIRYGVIQ